MSRTTRKCEELENAIGYSFVFSGLLEEALTHRSYVNETDRAGIKDNERLEFFGDAVLEFILSQLLLERFPESREGPLTKMRASLVDEESLALMAVKIGLGSCLRLGKGEERSGGRSRKSILADAYEALLAAIYLDGGIVPARALVEKQVGYLLQMRAGNPGSCDYKTEFQEQVQSRYGLTPHYILREATGPDHDRIFTVAALAGHRQMGEASGRSKKEAEQAAARIALELLITSE